MSRLPWEGPLFPVRGHLAERYALALKYACGLDCPLHEFGVDRMGWSPQIAATLGENYLGGDGMRYAIILSPDQGKSPPLRRRYSYEGPLVEKIYQEARDTLLNVIEYEPIVAELDNDLTFCRTATDVLSIRYAHADLETPRGTLGKTTKLLEQARGLTEKARLLDDGYIDKMLALVKDVGDPRKRPLPPELRVTVGSLWAEVDGAVYVLRLPGASPTKALVIATRLDSVLSSMPVATYEIDDARVVDVLHHEGFLSFEHADALVGKRLEELELDTLLTANEEIESTDGTVRRRQLNRSAAARAALPQLYWELSSEQKRLDAGGTFDPQRVSVDARWALATPAQETEIIVNLLSRFVRFDYRLLVNHQRRSVEAAWNRYSEAKRRYLERTFPYLTQSFVQAARVQPGQPAAQAGTQAAM